MSHMITATGQEYHFSPFAPAALRPVCIADVAHQLSLINRFHGATTRPYSVAEHSLLVSALAREQGLPAVVQMAGLMHDAHEIYTNDLASPAKHAVDGGGNPGSWSAFEANHAHHLRAHFGLLTVFAAYRETIRHLDLVALATERATLTAWCDGFHTPWPCLRDGQADAILPSRLDLLHKDDVTEWHEWRDFFSARYHQLKAEIIQASELQLHDPANQPGGAHA